VAWTDERLDDLAARMDAGFAAVGLEIRDLRTESVALRRELKGDMDGLRTELKGDMGVLRTELRSDFDRLQSTMLRVGIAIVVGLVGVIATLIAAVAAGPVGG
jgi:hypothetical protein